MYKIIFDNISLDHHLRSLLLDERNLRLIDAFLQYFLMVYTLSDMVPPHILFLVLPQSRKKKPNTLDMVIGSPSAPYAVNIAL